MNDLTYIGDDIPLIGPGAVAGSMGEEVPVVEPTGLVVGRADRRTVHGMHLLHPVVHLHIINRSGEIYLQKRAAVKELYPGYWDTAVGGHVAFGESFDEALFRESSEELGFTLFNPVQLGIYVYESQEEKELVSVYAAVGDFQLDPHSDEVESGAWFSEKKLNAAQKKGELTPSFERDWREYRNQIFALL